MPVLTHRDCEIISVFFFFFSFFRAILVAFGSSQGRGRIRDISAVLYHSNSDAGSEPHL